MDTRLIDLFVLKGHAQLYLVDWGRQNPDQQRVEPSWELAPKVGETERIRFDEKWLEGFPEPRPRDSIDWDVLQAYWYREHADGRKVCFVRNEDTEEKFWVAYSDLAIENSLAHIDMMERLLTSRAYRRHARRAATRIRRSSSFQTMTRRTFRLRKKCRIYKVLLVTPRMVKKGGDTPALSWLIQSHQQYFGIITIVLPEHFSLNWRGSHAGPNEGAMENYENDPNSDSSSSESTPDWYKDAKKRHRLRKVDWDGLYQVCNEFWSNFDFHFFLACGIRSTLRAIPTDTVDG